MRLPILFSILAFIPAHSFADNSLRGNPQAAIQIVKYADLECPYGKAVQPMIKKALAKYGDRVKFVFKTMPLDYHPTSHIAARYFYALSDQNEQLAYRFYHLIYENQNVLKSGDGNEGYLESSAAKLGADMIRLKKDMKSASVQSRIDRDIAQALELKINETPGLVIGGQVIPGIEPTWQQIESAIQKALRTEVAAR
jgi:protein-disulfide isomerase